MTQKMAKCPICDAEVKRRGENPSFPFCTPRCKTIDLGKWLNEEYRIPVENDQDEIAAGDSDPPSDEDPKPSEDMRH